MHYSPLFASSSCDDIGLHVRQSVRVFSDGCHTISGKMKLSEVLQAN